MTATLIAIRHGVSIPMASSGPVYQIGASSTPPFAQQGQVDWVALGNTTWHLTSAVLQRFASADLQPVTYSAALALGCRFTLGPVGRKHLSRALAELSATSTFQKLLWFGFGQKSFVRLLSANEPGLRCIGLCACLADTHSLEVSAYVLGELWKECSYPREYEPSHEQFVKLVQACQGILATSSFGRTVEHLLGNGRLSIDVESDDSTDNLEKSEWTRCANAKQIAQALCALFDVTSGKLKHITIVGMAEVAFIGALASWLFDLKVRADGIPDTAPDRRQPQVTLCHTPASNVDVEASNTDLARIDSRTFFLQGSGEFWSQLHSAGRHTDILIHRVPWDSCLYRSFGSRFLKLCEMSFCLSDFIGSAARIYTGFALCEVDVGIFEDYRPSWIDYSNMCHGEPFLAFIVSRFPELGRNSDLPKLMHLAVNKSFSEALKIFQESVLRIRSFCECEECRGDHLSSKTCLVKLASTILNLARCLAPIEIEPNLLPTISGIQQIYDSIKPYRWTNETSASPYWPSLLQLQATTPRGSLGGVVHLFSGTHPQPDASAGMRTSSEIMTAISWGGICGFTEALRYPVASPQALRIIHVRAGHIMREERQWSAVLDHPDAVGTDSPNLWWKGYNDVGKSNDIRSCKTNMEAVVTERLGGSFLNFSYQVSVKNKVEDEIGLRPLYLPPGAISKVLLESFGLIDCAHDPRICGQTKPAIMCQETPPGMRVGSNSSWNNDQSTLDFGRGIVCCASASRDEDVIDRWIATYLYLLRQREMCLLFRGRECLECCAKTAWKYGEPLLKRMRLAKEPERVVVQVIENNILPLMELES